MLSLKATLICCLFGFGLFSFAHQSNRPVTLPQTSVMEEAANPLPAILKEIRLIKSIIPRSNLNSFNAEITLNRIRLQNENVKALAIQLDLVRAQQKKTKEDSDEMRLIRKTFEERLQRTTDPVQRSSLEYSIEQMKLKSDNSFLSIQELRNQEDKISNQLQMEQNRLNEFNDRLDAIQREIEAQLIKPER